jgi:C1A family cysteine protease
MSVRFPTQWKISHCDNRAGLIAIPSLTWPPECDELSAQQYRCIPPGRLPARKGEKSPGQCWTHSQR